MVLVDVTRETLLDALARFDREDRSSSDWAGWETNGNNGYAILHEGRRYPPKRVITLATGRSPESFSGGVAGANRYLQARGFRVEPLRALTGTMNGLHDALEGILSGYLESKATTVSNQHPVVAHFRAAETALRSSSPVSWREELNVSFSVGKGNWSKVPWIAVMDERETDTTQRGTYVVYLVRQDCSGVYLTLNQGVTTPIAELGRPKGLQYLRERAATMRTQLPELAKAGFSFGDEIDLTPKGQLGEAYEASTVAHKFYAAGQVPSDAQLEIDLEEILRAYDAVLDLQDEEPVLGPIVLPPSDLIDSFSRALRRSGLTFGNDHDVIVRGFVSSLLAKPFALLTGLSGSGKTQLALKFGEWLGDGHFRIIAVRPDWTGPEYLLGYEDALLPSDGGRRAWHVPEALELMLEAARDPMRPYLLVLDEMNLAHVERYFADVLSGIESREAVLPNLQKEEGGFWRIASGQKAKLKIPRNLFIVGTVNVDETTYMFSPKVLDRANTIEFRVTTEALPTDVAAVTRPARCDAASGIERASVLAVSTDDEWHARNSPASLVEFGALVRHLHEGLSTHSFEFGHRTYFEGLRLAAILAAAGAPSSDALVDAFVLQKVLPRLHGAKRKLEPILRSLGAFAFDRRLMNKASGDFELVRPPPSPPLMPRSYDKLARMLSALQANQFASFSD